MSALEREVAPYVGQTKPNLKPLLTNNQVPQSNKYTIAVAGRIAAHKAPTCLITSTTEVIINISS